MAGAATKAVAVAVAVASAAEAEAEVASAAEAEAAKAPDAATGASNRTDSKGFKNKVFPTDEPRLKTARFFILRSLPGFRLLSIPQ